MGRQMTRYSRQVIPGRTQGEDGGGKVAIDSMVFGAKKKPAFAGFFVGEKNGGLWQN